MRIRKAQKTDSRALAQLYYETVHAINSRDYNARQLHAWAPAVYPDSFWLARLRRYEVYVAVVEGRLVGFAEFDRRGYIDCFYVHHLQQGRGVGKALMRKMIQLAKRYHLRRLRADVSITARAFFEGRGFRLVRRQKKIYRGQPFKQLLMESTV